LIANLFNLFSSLVIYSDTFNKSFSVSYNIIDRCIVANVFLIFSFAVSSVNSGSGASSSSFGTKASAGAYTGSGVGASVKSRFTMSIVLK
jgi:hypothetical protein